MEYLYKLSFPTKEEEWETFKKENLLTTIDDNEVVKPEFTILGKGHLPKAPPPDWKPDPDNPDDTGWSTYSDYSVDIMCKEKTNIFNDYLISKPKRNLREIQGAVDLEIIYKQ